MLKILSWNVNGLRACVKNGFEKTFKELNADIIGLQEIKATPEQIEKDNPQILNPNGYVSIWNSALRPGYSGTALYSKNKPGVIEKGFGIKEFDEEGRIIIAKYTGTDIPFTLLNIYYPNGQMSEERLQYKLRFYDSFLEYVDALNKKGENLIIMGDFNTAHNEIDLKNPKANEDYSGFLPVERAWIDKFISHGYVDTFRALHPAAVEYSWWTYRFKARERNIGWRIDYIFVNQRFFSHVKDSFILKDVMGSDHCPVGVLID